MTDDAQATSREADYSRGISREAIDTQITSRETVGTLVTSRETLDTQITSRETVGTQVTSREISELLKANTSLVVWLVFLAIGGGLLALYYARIGYLPDIEWSSAIIYLAAASFIGGGVGLLLALSLLLPGLIWSEFLVFDAELVGEFCYDSSGSEPCMRSILNKLGLPFGVVLLISHIALLTGVILYSAIAVGLLATIFFVMQRRFDGLLSGDSTARRRRIFKYSSWFTLSVLLNQISMLVIYLLSGRPRGSSFIAMTLICTTGVLISNHVVAVRYHHHPRQAIAAALVAASLLLFASDRLSPLALRIMTFYGFGEGHKVNLLVNDEGAAIIEKLGLPNRCIPMIRERLCDVEILSKVGDEYYLSIEGRTFTLPRSTVISRDSTDRRNR